MDLLKPTNDYVFKRIFGQVKNNDILKDLLQAILPDINIENLEVQKEVQLETNFLENKIGRLDILATVNDGTKINIEMQIRDYKNTLERSLFYASSLYTSAVNRSSNYSEIPKTISIWILKFDEFEEGPFHEIARLKRDYENMILTDKFEIHFIQLPKFRRKCKTISSKLDEWLTFISFEKWEELSMIENEHVKKAEEELEYLSGDEAERRKAEILENGARDYAFGISGARKEGLEQGEKEKSIQIAKKMLEKKMDINVISELTGLTKEEIEKL